MIEVNSEPIGARINGKFLPLPPRLARALETLIRGPAKILVEGKDHNNQKVCAHQLRYKLAGTGYSVAFSDLGYVLIKENESANP